MPRVDEKSLFYDPNIYYRRKEVAQNRLDSVTNYVNCTNTCRSQLLLAYFGEAESEPCGKCDYCLQRERERLRSLEFSRLSSDILSIYNDCTDIKEMVSRLCTRYEEEKIVVVTRWLIDNKKLKAK